MTMPLVRNERRIHFGRVHAIANGCTLKRIVTVCENRFVASVTRKFTG